MAMPTTLAERGYKAPTKESGTQFKWANGEELWTFLGSHPERAMNMVAGMKSLSSGSLAGDAYSFGEELAKLDIKDEDVAIVDITGGQGHIVEEVRKNPNIKGNIIIQDLASIFEAVPTPPAGVEFMPYDMFTPQPVKKAHVYYFRHIFHDWNDLDTGRYLEQLVPLLKEQPQSKLLLVDLVLPDTNASMQGAMRDLIIFQLVGWRELSRNGGSC